MVTTNIPFNIPLFSLGSIYSTNASGAEQMTETNNSNITGLRIPTSRRQTSWLFTSVMEDMNSRYREQIQLVVRAGLELGTSELQVQRSNHSATLPPTV